MFVKLIKPLSFLPAILLMYVIFSFSAQDGITSSALSYRVSYTIVDTANDLLNLEMTPERVEYLAGRAEAYVRKGAHTAEYFALAIAVAFPFYVYGLHGIALMIVAGFICVAFACTDEYHQSFIEGRSPSGWDVAIDSVGVFFGIIVVRILGWTGRVTIFRPRGKNKRTEEDGEPKEKVQKKKDRRAKKQADDYYEEDEEEEETFRRSTDELSEDMSLKKLIRDLASKEDDSGTGKKKKTGTENSRKK